MMINKKVLGLFLVILFWMTSASAAVITVTPDDMNGWVPFAEGGPGGSVHFVSGPGTPPLGTGSAQFTLDTNTSGMVLGFGLSDVRLDALTALNYSTYNTVGNNTISAALQFNIDYDLTDNALNWQGRLVYEPYYDNQVQDGMWQTWDALAGRWWMTGNPIANDTASAQICGIGAPCSIADILNAFPNAGLHSSFGAVLFKAGSGWAAGSQVAVDAFTLGIDGQNTTFDFEASEVSAPAAVGLLLLGMGLMRVRRK
ncbi:hypothetical protein DRW07_05415 [Alteromonas sediminis]|uniref:PEP-CTERM sorting domain-containing protein n=1 Tax=Alteromonas sediminis TaxID=2259342 RepID=A0A3N5Y219_9ALTE|nr:hypothetical protein [Alteromonas sediminis]RPJ66983.1 hypothetical protein DRW07_05415 [Alteromonas sediminis]